MNIKSFAVGPIAANCYLFWDEETKDTAVIDPGYPDHRVEDFIINNGLKVSKILITHGHFDHIGGVDAMRNLCPEAKVYIHCADADALLTAHRNLSTMTGRPMTCEAPADVLISEGDVIEIGRFYTLKVLHTPGHSSGGVCFVGRDLIFTGDTLFCGSVGRTDFPDGDFGILMDSVDKIMACGTDMKVYPGHGEASDLNFERQMNPFVRRRGQQ